MTDEEYLFRQTEREAKRTARGAYAKKGGSKSKKCSLPSDYLTAKEKKGMNGKVMEYKTKGVTWHEFKYYPVDVRNHILNTYASHGATLSDAARYLGISAEALRSYLNRHKSISVNFRNGKGCKSASPEWTSWIREKETEEPQTEEPVVEETVKPTVKMPVMVTPDGGRLRFTGDISRICVALSAMLDPDKIYSIGVEFAEAKV